MMLTTFWSCTIDVTNTVGQPVAVAESVESGEATAPNYAAGVPRQSLPPGHWLKMLSLERIEGPRIGRLLVIANRISNLLWLAGLASTFGL